MRTNPGIESAQAAITRRGGALLAALLLATGCGTTTSSAEGDAAIDTVAPASGPLGGGATVTITGRGLDDGGGDPTVLFGSVPGEVDSASDREIVVRAPAGSGCGSVDVQVVHGSGSASRAAAFAYVAGTAALQLGAIEPPFGEIAGNTTVTITGSGFEDGVAVTLDGRPLADVQVLDGSTITARTPAGSRGGAVDLAVRNCAGETSRAGGFTYTTGLRGGVAALTRTDVIHPERFTGTPPDFVEGYLTLQEPHPQGATGTPPPLDTCVVDTGSGTPVPGAIVYRDAGATVRLESAAKILELPQQVETGANGTIREYYLPGGFTDLSLYVENARYDVSAPGSSSVRGFTVAGALTAPPLFQVTAPADLHADSAPSYSKSSPLAFAWTPGVPSASVFEIVLLGFSGIGQQTGERIRCFATDDGQFQIPTTALQGMPQAASAVYFLRRRTGGAFPSPENGSTIAAVAYTQEVGAFRLAP